MAGINDNNLLRIDVSRVNSYIGPEVQKLTAGQKFGRFMGKAVSFLAPVAGSVLSVMFPGAGTLIGSLAYGAGKVAGDAVNKSYMKENIAVQNSAQQMANMPITMPGLFENNSQPMQSVQNFNAPGQFLPQINSTMNNRESSRMNALGSF